MDNNGKKLFKTIDRSEIQELILEDDGLHTVIQFKDAEKAPKSWVTEDIILTSSLMYLLVPDDNQAAAPTTKRFTLETFRDVQQIITGLVLTTPINKIEEALHEKFKEMEADLF